MRHDVGPRSCGYAAVLTFTSSYLPTQTPFDKIHNMTAQSLHNQIHGMDSQSSLAREL